MSFVRLKKSDLNRIRVNPESLDNEEVAIEFNKIINTPYQLVDKLLNYKRSIENSSRKKDQIEYIEDLMNQLENWKKIPNLIKSKSLCDAAHEYLKINKKSSMLDNRFYREEKEFLSERLTHYCFGFNEVFQFVENE